MPLFLEGFVRHMKVLRDMNARAALYQQVRNSDLHDKALQMYRISSGMGTQPMDIGRLQAFAPGWLEHQSVWTHMSYKFYLELLRAVTSLSFSPLCLVRSFVRSFLCFILLVAFSCRVCLRSSGTRLKPVWWCS